MREQPTAQYGQREWTSFAPEIRRSSERFFAAATSKPSGLARGTSAIPAVPAAPSFRNSRRVISVIGFGLFYSRVFASARRTLDFSPDERVLQGAGKALEGGRRATRREDRAAGARRQGRHGAVGAGARRVAHQRAPV